MLRKCVSLGNLGLAIKGFDSDIADLYGPRTASDPSHPGGYSNLSFLEDSETPWVRLFVVWSFFWPNPPAPFGESSSAPYQSPVPSSAQNYNQVLAQLRDLDRNIQTAKTAGRKVILTTLGYPKWLNGTDPSSVTEIVLVGPNAVLPPDSVLMMPAATPPGGRMAFLPTDFMYSRWIHDLILRYHPRSPFRPTPDTWIDALELVNEPNSSFPAGSRPPMVNKALSATPSHSTALMMRTAQSVKTHLNNAYGGGMKLLGPATGDSDGLTGSADPRVFTADVIDELTGDGRQPIVDRDFGWSHHNYADVELIGQTLSGLGSLPDPVLKRLAPLFYGPKTQQVRGILDGKWFGWGTEGDPDPLLFLTEGGARLESLIPGHKHLGDLNTDYSARPPRDPEAYRKQLQKYSVGGAAQALRSVSSGGLRKPFGGVGVGVGVGAGVQMFTNFLFFDNSGAVFSGLCDQYGPGRKPPASNETASQYMRPAYAAWKKFGL